ncbi:chromatin remodeling protein SHL-like, partial [Camellia sinensis]|uniref:chromatin remodeling protein SHL-like n=1 Tax=Camellia sinensis TaxID=4442 RepID=UPI0010360479
SRVLGADGGHLGLSVEHGDDGVEARVEQIESDSRGGNVRVQVRWYYRPEESIGGRRQFHGSKELFLSDHYDVQSADTIEGKCTVHTFKSYTKLDAVGNDDFFCRFEYNSSTGAFNPDRVAVYCKCEMPYNPDDLMVQCEGCTDWFHPTCIEMVEDETAGMDLTRHGGFAYVYQYHDEDESRSSSWSLGEEEGSDVRDRLCEAGGG